MRITKIDTFPVSRQTFIYDVFLEETFNKLLHEHLDFESRIVRKRDEDDSAIRMVIDYVPNRSIPVLLKKMLGGERMGYQEDLVFYKDSWRLESIIRPNSLGDRIRFDGNFVFEDDANGHVRRTYTCDVTAKIPIGSKMLAKKLVKTLDEDYATAVRFIEKYIAKGEYKK